MEDRLNIEVGSTEPGTLGSAIIGGKATEILDVAHYLPLAYADWFIRKERGRRKTRNAGCCSWTTRRSSATCCCRC